MSHIVVIAASQGGLGPLGQIAAAFLAACNASIFIVEHIGNNASILPAHLERFCKLPVTHAVDGDPIKSGHIYVAPPDRHMTLEYGCIRLDRGPMIHDTRPAGEPLFLSAAQIYGDRVIGIVLSGKDGDVAEGLRVVKECGGMAMVQDPREAAMTSMPRAAIAADHPTVLTAQEIARILSILCLPENESPDEALPKGEDARGPENDQAPLHLISVQT